jgi:hypothetical protein
MAAAAPAGPGLRGREEQTRRALRESAARLFGARGPHRVFFRCFGGRRAPTPPDGAELFDAPRRQPVARAAADQDPPAPLPAPLAGPSRTGIPVP